MKSGAYVLMALILFTSCNNNKTTAGNNGQTAIAIQPIPVDRSNPNTKPVATYSQNITTEMGRLNHWKFTVALYETHRTFTYRMQIQYAELAITDSLQLPNLGFMPKPALQKGKDDYSCIIGFLDNKNVFRDYKIVKETNGYIRIHTLKYYSVQPATTVQ